MSKTEEEKINLTDIIQNNSMSTLISITKAKERRGIHQPAIHMLIGIHHTLYVAPSDWLKKKTSNSTNQSRMGQHILKTTACVNFHQHH